jgi:demethylmenaquinone methyltransferase/2-methoxy-6-polyprenyl-1,4-benzoquinol methylase
MSKRKSVQSTEQGMRSYYEDRAPVYDRVYAYPERQSDLRFLEEYIPGQFVGREVLEVAAGTGYWSQFIAPAADLLLATDAGQSPLGRIAKRNLDLDIVTKIADAYSLDGFDEYFSGLFAGCWLSHVPKKRLNEFLDTVHQRLTPGALILLLDNSSAQCVRLPLSFTDESGNTYQDRTLDDGSIHRVLKNFPTEEELLDLTRLRGTDHKFISLEHYWLFQYVAN